MAQAKKRTASKSTANGSQVTLVRQLRARIRELERERKYHVKAIYAMMPPSTEPEFTAESIRDLDENGVPFEEVIRTLKELKRNNNGKPKRAGVRG